MAGRPAPSTGEPTGAADGPEKPGGHARSSQNIEEFMEMVMKLQKAGSLEPRVEVLLNRVKEVQQAKKRANEELAEARTLWEALQKELDALNGYRVRLEEILSQKQETLRTLRLHCREKERRAQRKQAVLQQCKERISALDSKIEDQKIQQRQLRLHFEEQLEDLMDQHKKLWEFHPERLAREIAALDISKEQLLKEEKLTEAKLEDVKHRLWSQFGAKGPSAIAEGLFLRSQEAACAVRLFEEENRRAQQLLEDSERRHAQLQQKRQRLKEEVEKLRLQLPAQAQNKPEEGAGPEEAASHKRLGQ